MAFANVQKSPDVGTNGGTGQTASLAFSSPVTAGNTVVGIVEFQQDPITAFTVVDNNAVSQNVILLGRDSLFTGNWFGLFWKTGVTGGPTTYTVTNTDFANLNMILWLEEWSGFSAGATIDGHAFAAVADTTGANSMTTPSITTTVNGDFIWAPAFALATADTLTVGTVPAYTVSLNNNNPTPKGWWTEWLTQSTAGSIAATWQASGTANGFALGLLALTQTGSATGIPVWLLRS